MAGTGGRLLLLVGAGLTGSVLVGNTRVQDLLADVSKVLSKHLKDSGQGAEELTDATTAALTNQVRRLTMELRQLSSSQRPITVMNTVPTQGGAGVALILPVAAAGAAGYGYMWWNGLTFSDLMYVTRRSMENAVNNMGKQMEVFSTALAQTKQQLASRIAMLTKTLDESVEMQNQLREQMEKVGQDVREDVERVGQDIENVQRLVEGLEGKLDQVAEKQDFANHGIILLVRFVTQTLEGRQKQEALQGLNMFSRPRLEATPTFPGAGASLGLKDLQSLAESLASDEASTSSAAGPSMLLPSLSFGAQASSGSGAIKRTSSQDQRAAAP